MSSYINSMNSNGGPMLCRSYRSPTLTGDPNYTRGYIYKQLGIQKGNFSFLAILECGLLK